MALILVIEDNPQSARMVVKLLAQKEHEVVSADTGEAGLIAAMEKTPDIILIDLGLPDIDGQTVIGLMRQNTELENTPLVAFTAWPEETAYSMALAYGCDGVITKPINTRTFVDQVLAFLKKENRSST